VVLSNKLAYMYRRAARNIARTIKKKFVSGEWYYFCYCEQK